MTIFTGKPSFTALIAASASDAPMANSPLLAILQGAEPDVVAAEGASFCLGDQRS